MISNNEINHLYEIKIEDTEPSSSGWFDFDGYFPIFQNDSNAREFDTFSRDGHKYYALPNNKEYGIRMVNNSDLRVNATLKIDGEVMGKWRINKYSDILIERPSHNNRKFTFVRDNSWQAGMAGVKSGAYQNGLVEVTFTPEVRSYRSRDDDSRDGWQPYSTNFGDDSRDYLQSHTITNNNNSFTPQSASLMRESSNRSNRSNKSMNFSSTNSYSAGATVLGDDSSQKFNSASHINEDTSKSITKRVRLVVADERKPYVSIRKREYDDPTPPPITNANDFIHYDRTFARNFDPSDGFARPKVALGIPHNNSPFHFDQVISIRNNNDYDNYRNDKIRNNSEFQTPTFY